MLPINTLVCSCVQTSNPFKKKLAIVEGYGGCKDDNSEYKMTHEDAAMYVKSVLEIVTLLHEKHITHGDLHIGF